ncbi:MAG TPA: response regulator transcription factor [Burkholderiaceae bacterium]|nr:response regulator transcription factor [Burkholderiaceae bacterium]
MVNVFVVDDTLQVRKRLVAILRTVEGVCVVGEADSVGSAIDGVLAADVDTLLLDLKLPDGTGLDVLAALKPQRPDIRVIVLSNFASAQHRQASLGAGADVFLDKSHEFGRVPQILREWIASPPPRAH